ncbi:MAG: polysaccharide pyruvyl transferase family protein [Phycisphaerales bacterium]
MTNATDQPASASPGTVREQRVREFFEDFRGARVCHPELVNDKGVLVGNNGDRLMVLGTDRLYNDFGVERVEDPAKADLIAIGGNGGMHERFTWIPRIFEHHNRTYPGTPLVILPSTFHYPTRPFQELISTERTAPLTIFCRERYSAEQLVHRHQLPDGVDVRLDRDMAFELEGTDLIKGLQGRTGQHVLMIERVDVEHPSVRMNPRRLGLRGRISKRMPDGLKKMLYPLVVRHRSRQVTPFRQRCEQLLAEHHPEFASLPVIAKDISSVNTCSFEEFCELTADAAVVFSTRLHGGIFSSLVDRPTFIFEGPYHKIRGIWEYALADHPQVTFVPLADGEQPAEDAT